MMTKEEFKKKMLKLQEKKNKEKEKEFLHRAEQEENERVEYIEMKLQLNKIY